MSAVVKKNYVTLIKFLDACALYLHYVLIMKTTKKDKFLTIRLSEKDRASLHKAARREKKTVTDLLMSRVLPKYQAGSQHKQTQSRG
jgi:hypothetical protein